MEGTAINPVFGVITSLIFFVGFFIKGLAAFGDPLITTPLLSLYAQTRVISPTNLVYSIPINGYIAWKNRAAFSLRQILPILLFVLMGVVPGTLLMKYATSWVIKLFLGFLVLAIGVEMITRNSMKPAKPNNVVMAVSSLCSGFTAGLYGINLFFVAYLERTTKGREAFRGNICFIFFFESVFRMVLYAATGMFNREMLGFALWGLPGAAAGFLVGTRIDKNLSEAAIRKIVIAMFMLAGVSIVVKAAVWKS